RTLDPGGKAADGASRSDGQLAGAHAALARRSGLVERGAPAAAGGIYAPGGRLPPPRGVGCSRPPVGGGLAEAAAHARAAAPADRAAAARHAGEGGAGGTGAARGARAGGIPAGGPAAP